MNRHSICCKVWQWTYLSCAIPPSKISTSTAIKSLAQLVCSPAPIFGYHDETALAHAVDLGVALQLTNILRDIGEDFRRNRIYIPQEEMQYFGYCEQELMDGVINDAFRGLLRFQIARAEDYFERAQPGIALLNADCRLAVRLSSSLYHAILDRIRLNQYNVFTKRASVPLKTKLAAIPQYWFIEQWEMRAKG